MSKFTKGTWKYLDAINQVCAFDKGAKWPNDWPTDITGELCYNGNEEEVHANGRLIAEAPYMYELLKYLAEGKYLCTLRESAQSVIARIDGKEEDK